MRFCLKSLSRGFIPTYTFNFGPKIYDFAVHVPPFLIYVNSATFLFSVGMALKFTFRLLIPKYGGRENWIFKIPCREFIFKPGVFSSFFTFLGRFVNRSLLPNFRVLRAPVPLDYRNEVPFSQISYFIASNMHKNDLNIVHNYEKITLFITLYMKVHDFTIHSICVLTLMVRVNLAV